MYVFGSFETIKSSILKQLVIKILGGHSRFLKLHIDKQKAHMYVFETL